MLDIESPRGQVDIDRFLLETLPALGPPPRGEEGLERARRFFAMCGDPQNVARQIHVVGTAGKGTAAAAIIATLVGAGLSVGAHLSPHVYDLRERFLIDGQLPTWDAVGDALAELWPAMREMAENEGRPPSFFEVTTAIAWTVANRAGATVHVTEAGIGGTYDSTNTITRPDKITVVTSIGFDHEALLGDTIDEIAANKADVIARDSTVVLGPQPWPAARDLVLAVAADRGATVIEAGDVAMTFEHQAAAIGDAIRAVLVERGVAPAHRPEPAAVHLPGRMETIATNSGRVLILDGAHNPLKLRGLRSSLEHRPDVVVAALSAEKDLEGCATEIALLADVIVTCQFAVTAAGRVVRQSWPSAELAQAIAKARPDAEVHEAIDVASALSLAADLAPGEATILATGSFMMIDPARSAASELGSS